MAKQKDLTFEAALKELNEIAARLDAEGVSIDEGLRSFERGLILVKFLKQRLQETENKVRELKVKFSDVFDAPESGV